MNRSSIPYILLHLLFINIFLSGCSEEPEKDPADKLTFKYFPGDPAERLFRFDNQSGFYMTLPSCFKVDAYTQISITNTNNYECDETQSYFSIDRFTPEDMDYYTKYYGNDSTVTSDPKELLMNYVLDSRMSNISIKTKSIETEANSKAGIPILLAAIKGSQSNYSNPLFYQYALFQVNDDIYLVQFIVNEEDVSFYHDDLLTMITSVRAF